MFVEKRIDMSVTAFISGIFCNGNRIVIERDTKFFVDDL